VKLFLLFLALVFVAGFALPTRISLRWPVAALCLVTAVGLMTHRLA
jgi:hypothetical protein